MVRDSELKDAYYSIGKIAKLIGVTPKTIQNYTKNGKLECTYSSGGQRRISKESLIAFLSSIGVYVDDRNDSKHDAIYCRVSSGDQKQHGDLDRQVMKILESCPNLQNPVIYKEVGSGLNDRRKRLLELIGEVLNGNVRNVYVTYKDRLTRFGFNYLKMVFASRNTDIIVLNDSPHDKDAQRELIDDMMSLIASFSGKLYGMRSHKKGKEV